MIGYCVPAFPAQTHAFFWREASALRELGLPVRFLSTRRPPDAACPHVFGAEARAATRYVAPPSAGAFAFLAARPAALARAAGYVARLGETSAAGRLRLAALIPCAAEMVLACREAGVRHVHIHSCADAAHLGALARLLGGLSYSLTLHGDLLVYGVDHAAKMRGAAFVTAVTRPLRAQIEAVLPGRDAAVITMGVEIDRFAPADRSGRAGPPHLVSVARLHPNKGHADCLEAIARLKGQGVALRWSIAGEGPHRAEIEAAIARLGLGDAVRLVGSIGEAAVKALLDDADMFALTSFGQGEAAPVAVMEAMACGLPVVCSRIGGTGDMIEHGVDGLLTAQRDVADIAGALGTLARDPGLRARVGAAARATAERRFDHRLQAGALADLLRRALAAA